MDALRTWHPMPTKGTTRHAIRIPDELWAAALAKAQEQEPPDKLSEILRAALVAYLERK